jgi:alpha-tubulin suppressor-like RCC1 family protein
LENGTLCAWGDNKYGQCDISPDFMQPAADLSHAVQQIVCGSYHTVVLLEDGALHAWGNNTQGQCNVPPDLPRRFRAEHETACGTIKQIACGAAFTVVLLEDGTIRAWGDNSFGQCNVPPDFVQPAAHRFRAEHETACGTVRQIACGHFCTFVLLEDGTLRAWGDNRHGQCNVPPDFVQPASHRFRAEHETACDTVQQIACGRHHTVVLLEDGTLRAWGDNQYGQCDVPQDFAQPVKQIVCGAHHTAVLSEDGTLCLWGCNLSGQCNVPPDFVPRTVKQIACGAYHTILLLEDDTVRAWGDNEYGQCNVPPDLSHRFRAEHETACGTVKQIACGYFHTVVLLEDSTIRAWGSNGLGQCNVPPDLPHRFRADFALCAKQPSAEHETACGTVKQITCGAHHTAVLLEDGTLRAWGDNQHGQCNVPADLPPVRREPSFSLKKIHFKVKKSFFSFLSSDFLFCVYFCLFV